MPTSLPVLAALLLVAIAAGLLAGWLLRSRRCVREKRAVSAGWQQQIDAQQKENERIATQNTSLMDQVRQQQEQTTAARSQARKLARELSTAREAHAGLQEQIREIRGNLELAIVQRDKLRSNARSSSARSDSVVTALRERDDKIARLKRELGRWQERVPPLVERYRVRDLEAQELEIELERANNRLRELQSDTGGNDGTRIESIAEPPIGGMDASNDQYDDDEHEDAPVPSGGDDLKRIKGIGPAIERTLKRLGITRFSQIAELSDFDVDRVADELRGFRSRILREDWIGQARLLQHESAGDSPPGPA